METYSVQKIPNKSLTINGRSDAVLWNNAEKLTSFLSPWSDEDIAPICFKALYDDENLYFSFLVSDPNIYTDVSGNSVENIGNSDRVELFFRVNDQLNPYYCLEMDTSVRIMDFEAKPNKDFNFDWNWPEEDIDVQSNITDTSFVVEGAISLKSLRSMNLIKDNKMETGIFRAKYSKNTEKDYEPTWITWVDPKTKDPNFHIASSFGLLVLE
jgi:hypothetical protein